MKPTCSPVSLTLEEGRQALEPAVYIVSHFFLEKMGSWGGGASPHLQGLRFYWWCLLHTSSLASLPHTIRYPKLMERSCQANTTLLLETHKAMILHFPFFGAWDNHRAHMKTAAHMLETGSC